MRVALILPAAGRGTRFAGVDPVALPKTEHPLLGKPVFQHALDRFAGVAEVAQTILAVAPERLEFFGDMHGESLRFQAVTLVPGGKAERWETVHQALQHADPDITHIAVHDAARCLTPLDLIQRVFAAAQQYRAAVPALAVSDTLKRGGGILSPVRSTTDPADAILGGDAAHAIPAVGIAEDVPRDGLFAVQTPQVFEADLLREAYAAMDPDRTERITDDAALVQALGEPVAMVPGDPLNFKLTRPSDAELAEAVLAHRLAEDKRRAAEAVLQAKADDDDE